VPLVDGVDPDEHAIKLGELCVDRVKDIVLIDRRFRINPDIAERGEDGPEPAGLWRSGAPRRFATAPQDSDAADASFGLRHERPLRIYAPMSFFLSAAPPSPRADDIRFHRVPDRCQQLKLVKIGERPQSQSTISPLFDRRIQPN